MKVLVQVVLGCLLLCLNGCSSGETRFELYKVLQLNDVKPLGIQVDHNSIWISDVDANALYRLDMEGNLLDSLIGFQRPMHFVLSGDDIIVAEYGGDQITKIDAGGNRVHVEWPDVLDAPSGVDVINGDWVVADFYGHRIARIRNGENAPFGKKGNEYGQFYYPTDVRFAHGKIWVADAYNHRIQVFDTEGNWLMTVGEDDEINAATGLALSKNLLAVTDFENNRVLLYDLNGNLVQVLTDHIERPTGVFIDDNSVYVTNYASGTVVVYNQVSD